MAMGVRKEAIGEAINLGSGTEHQVIEMAGIINELTENPAGVVYRPRRDWDAKTRLLSSIDKARRLLDYEPQVSFREGLERTHRWFTENWELIRKSAEF